MSGKESKKYLLLSIISIFIILILLSGCVDLTCAYVKNSTIKDGWYENTALRNTGTQFLGMEKWCSITYEINGKYPASLTVTTLKAIVLADEKDIQKKTRQTIEETFSNNIDLSENISGERIIKKSHKTLYIIYDGLDKNKNETVRIIGEVWNCASSGTSIICIGVAYITNNDIQNVYNLDNWQKIIKDQKGTINGSYGEDGLIYNICCH